MDRKLLRSILIIITYAVLLVVLLIRFPQVMGVLEWVVGLFRPLLIGFAIAFILHRPCRSLGKLYSRGLKGPRSRKLAQPLAVVSSYLLLIIIVVSIFSFILPKVSESIQLFVDSLNGYIPNFLAWANQLLDYLKLESIDLSGLDSILKNLFTKLFSTLSDFAPSLISFTASLASMVVTGVISLVFSIYMLSGGERLLGQCRRLIRAYAPAKFVGPFHRVMRLTADTFSHFVTGQLIEACILGSLCTIGMFFIQADYAPLIGVLIGTSALIPVAGAYLGAIVSALLLVMVSPLKALTFLIFLVILQQVEGNVIYPKVVGTSIGLPGIWVLAAVTVGGGLFGLVGVLLSVPVASVVYTLLKQDVRRRLDGKG